MVIRKLDYFWYADFGYNFLQNNCSYVDIESENKLAISNSRKFASVTTFFIIKYSGILLWLQLLLSHQMNFLITRLNIIAHLNIPVMRRIF